MPALSAGRTRWTAAGNAKPMHYLRTAAASLLLGFAAVALPAQSAVYKVGDRGPAGGIVFYDKGGFADGWRYLEAATEDMVGLIQWSDKFIDTETGTALGSGRANTAAISSVQEAGTYAAQLCRDLVIGGFHDWFLPSKDELDLMYRNISKAGLGDFSVADYWSSSQLNSVAAWSQNFNSGYQLYNIKTSGFRVRAVRAF
jgi:hypothetical protein